MAAKAKSNTREEWLNEAATRLNEWIDNGTDLKPSKSVLVSAGWPRRDKNGSVIGQCYTRLAGGGANHIFISPTLGTATEVLPTLLHELIHAADNNKSGHTGNFRKAWKALGYEGKATQSTPGKELKALLRELAGDLGKYPHKKLRGSDSSAPKPQTNRQLKIECPNCGYTARATRSWLDVGLPTCCCGTDFEEAT